MQQYKSEAGKVVPPQLQGAFERVIIAGHRLLYSKEMKPIVDKQLATESPAENKIAEGAVAIMLMLIQKSKPKMPQEVVVPGVVELVFEIEDFLVQGGVIEPLTEDQKKFSLQIAIGMMLKKLGADQNTVMGVLTKGKDFSGAA